MKVQSVKINARKRQLELKLRSGRMLPFPFARLDPRPNSKDKLERVFVDKELASEAVTYVLTSGAEGAVHVDHALEYNQDPTYLADIFTHKLTVEARRRVEGAGLGRGELARRLHTSVPQLYRLLDTTNTRKSLAQLVALLNLLDCDVEFVIHPRRAA